jgi:hypothetical protein
MKGKYNDERFDNLYEELKSIYPGHDVFGARYLDEDGYFPYYFNIKETESQRIPITVIVYEPDLAKAYIATSSDGVLEKQVVEYFNKNGIKSKLEMGIEKGSVQIIIIPFDKIKKL